MMISIPGLTSTITMAQVLKRSDLRSTEFWQKVESPDMFQRIVVSQDRLSKENAFPIWHETCASINRKAVGRLPEFALVGRICPSK